MSATCIRARQVRFGYVAAKPVLDNVDASVSSGELVGIVGPNGCGKTTLLRLFIGILTPQSGSVTIDGRPVSALSPRERARIVGFLPQTVNPIFSMRVAEVVRLGRYPHLGAFGAFRAHDHAVAERALAETETTALRDRDFFSLSGGERQRVLLASLLAQEPRLLLLDEPTSALDVHHQIDIFGLLCRLRDAGFGVAVVTHDINLAARYCDRMMVFGHRHRGIVAAGPVAQVITEPVLSEAYGARIRVCEHPLTKTPLITVETPTGALS